MTSRPGGRSAHALVAVMAVVLSAVVGLQAWLIVPHLGDFTDGVARGLHSSATGGDTRKTEPKADGDPTDPVVAGATKTFDARAAALRAGDEKGWLASLAPTAGKALRDQQAALFARLRQIPLTSFRYEIRSPEGDALGVRLVYRIKGQDRDVWRNQSYRVVQDDTGWHITGDLTPASNKDLWDLTDISVVSGKRSIIIGARSEKKRLKSYAQETDRAARKVDGIMGTSWPRITVVLAPGTSKQVEQITDLSKQQVAAFWALTFDTTLDGGGWTSRLQPAGLWVLINPDAAHGGDQWDRRIVMAHEMTHVATGYLERNDPPLWTEEGYAEQVAYRGEGLTRRDMTPEARDVVRSGDFDGKLPSDGDFRSLDADALAATYEFAWLVYDYIEDTYGAKMVDAFHREVTAIPSSRTVRPVGERLASNPNAVPDAVQKLFHTDLETFQTRWAADVRRSLG